MKKGLTNNLIYIEILPNLEIFPAQIEMTTF